MKKIKILVFLLLGLTTKTQIFCSDTSTFIQYKPIFSRVINLISNDSFNEIYTLLNLKPELQLYKKNLSRIEDLLGDLDTVILDSITGQFYEYNKTTHLRGYLSLKMGAINLSSNLLIIEDSLGRYIGQGFTHERISGEAFNDKYKLVTLIDVILRKNESGMNG